MRRQLACTAQGLAKTLGVDRATVLAWEKGELFSKKKYVQQMNELIQKKMTPASTPLLAADLLVKVLADPQLWTLFRIRKIVVHQVLRTAVEKVAADYPDPVAAPERTSSCPPFSETCLKPPAVHSS
ncbi:hypothetical protein [Pajaroellobacter abortibovis]|uniref:Uncharacterized protein n=1 Tax=Pajaroellobacter abortibovis TaxID=1882918 RepID=A0A1L6MY95_9BACT|nr:hypothetical protein [Pajaroellobacter abortibovis]APS00466.1 hypothetical protein BCY86_07095 [Pajaroellobacter abortibovis]